MSEQTNDHRPNLVTDMDRESSTTSESALSIKASHLQLTYSDGTEAVRDISLSVPEGEFFGFLGPNGAGKTTAIKVLATLLKPTSGDVFVNGFDVKDEPRKIRESIGYMAQEIGIDEELTARENIQFACAAMGFPEPSEPGESMSYSISSIS